MHNDKCRMLNCGMRFAHDFDSVAKDHTIILHLAFYILHS